MVLKKGSQINRGYATVNDDEGVNYREIADIMTELGFTMNHSSARNYVLRIMRKFVIAFNERWELNLDDAKISNIAKSPEFQQGIAEVMYKIETSRQLRQD